MHGDSKAKRLRAFWELESDQLAGKALSEMLDVWRFEAGQSGKPLNEAGYNQCKSIVARLLGEKQEEADQESQFLERDFGSVSVSKLKIEPALIPILESRIQEAGKCLSAGSSLAVIILCGSILEGALLGYAQQNPQRFNRATCSPKSRDGKVKLFQGWKLGELIDVACEIGLLKLDIKKFSHALRDFRNYIHPYQQMLSDFHPDQHTAKICMQVLKAAIAGLSKER